MAYLGLNPTSRRSKGATWRQKAASLRRLPALLKLVWQTQAWFTAGIVLLRVAQTAIPLASLWIGKLIIDAVISAREGDHNLSRLWKLVLLETGIVAAGQILARGSSLLEGLLGELFSNVISIRLMEHASTLDIRHFEDPAFYDRLDRARRQTTSRLGLITRLLQIGQDALTLVSLSLALVVYSPWLLLLLGVAVLPTLFGETHYAILQYGLFHSRTPGRRKLEYLVYLGAGDKAAKEVQLFGLSAWIVSRYRRLSTIFYRENRKLSIKRTATNAAFSLVSVTAYYAAYAIILFRTVYGSITIGTLTFLAGSFERGNDLMLRLTIGLSGIFEESLYLDDLFGFLEIQPDLSSAADAPPVPNPIREGFAFENVGFRYPDSDKWAVRNVSFHIRPEERVALVGENGAGKTTLTKLLARLYDVTEGRILLDGRDLRQYDLHSLRQAIGVIFQDFVKYDLSFAENIGVGKIEPVQSHLDEIEATRWSQGDSDIPAGAGRSETTDSAPGPIAAAAEKSLAATLLARLPDGYSQMLGRRFESGVELSGGEWQKVALARAYMRDAQLLILDEPTAALDARAEYEVFRRFSHIVEGRMAIIISHRFSTVRAADRIIVLDGGRVVENGGHEELVRAGGLYSELFSLQAEGYR